MRCFDAKVDAAWSQLLDKPTKKDQVAVRKGDVLDHLDGVIGSLDATYPGLKNRLCDEKGDLRRFVNIYVNEEDIRFLQNQKTPLKDGDEISIIPAIAGG